ncbi:hypothetical protein CEUSTIGMA_g5958.t1 [Chlamydomonas eustigma]|uniref:F-box domain-containing protein n=1 Tax=Chlamydomonas eustigma TaxID=1157962 RepID=A0A250X634_9CHLO|nr:hypothetical protein CEUSTIGMA_g5958.t1 [Chlamydomonas eustigma]|eukprot:GAX78518.1 hypothetical protein CEUSTIGMA_g5958.t1 [Chlamydomonas eustigma]
MSEATLLDIPQNAVCLILRFCDPYSFCSMSRACKYLLDMASSPGLWPDFKDDGIIFSCIRKTLSSVLHLPPQIYLLSDDSKRSSKFCISCPLYNLRGRLGVNDVEELASNTSRAIQDMIDNMPDWNKSWMPLPVNSRIIEHSGSINSKDSLPPHSVIKVCRADRGTLRFSLNPSVGVPLTYHDQLRGLPDLGALFISALNLLPGSCLNGQPPAKLADAGNISNDPTLGLPIFYCGGVGNK